MASNTKNAKELCISKLASDVYFDVVTILTDSGLASSVLKPCLPGWFVLGAVAPAIHANGVHYLVVGLTVKNQVGVVNCNGFKNTAVFPIMQLTDLPVPGPLGGFFSALLLVLFYLIQPVNDAAKSSKR